MKIKENIKVNVYDKSLSKKDLDAIIETAKNNNLLDSFEILGRGMYGVVYAFNKKYVIKVIKRKGSKDEQVLNDLKHLNFIPNIYASINNGIENYLIIERIHGMDLAKYLYEVSLYKNKFTIGMEFVDELKKQFIEIIENNYIPYDLGAPNIMINQDLMPHIVDTGLFEKHNHNINRFIQMSFDKKIKYCINHFYLAYKNLDFLEHRIIDAEMISSRVNNAV